MPTNLTEYGETATEKLTETGQIISRGFSEFGELIFGGAVEPTLKEVTDLLLLSDSTLRHKPALFIADNIDSTDSALNHKPSLLLADAVLPLVVLQGELERILNALKQPTLRSA